MQTGTRSRRRMILLLLIFAVLFTALTGRMSFLQIASGDILSEKAFRYRMRPTPIQANRGEILDRHGQPLLKNVVCESVYAQPPLLKDKAMAARQVAPILGMKVEEVERRMSRLSFFEWLSRKVTADAAHQIRDLGIIGLGFAPEKCRFYPEGEVAVHALGIANLDHQGIEGLELTYNRYLQGKNGAIQCEYTARGFPMEGGECRVVEGQDGLTLQTTLDIGLQRLAERDVERAALETRGKGASIMVMHVKTGEILALSQWPRYDPALGGNSDPALRRLFTVADTFPPGSIFKPITASAGLDSRVIDQNSSFNDTGCMQLHGWPICNWDHKANGNVGIDTIMIKSSNVGFATLGMRLGNEIFYNYHERFGLTRPTGIDLPGEGIGQWIPKKLATELDLAIQGFGQTLTVSPIQMLTAIAAIANDGKLMWPHLGKAILDRDGKLIKEIEPRVVRQVISPEVARLVQQLMVGVVEIGTGRNAQVPGYKVGGKTGTATKVIDGKTAKGSYIASFVGFAPYPNPEVAVLISVDEPQGIYYGGQIAAPIFGEVMTSVLSYLDAPFTKESPAPVAPGSPPARSLPAESIVPSLVNLPIDTATRVATQAGFSMETSGSGGFVTKQFPLAGATAYRGGVIRGSTDIPPLLDTEARVPDLKGMSARQAAEALATRGLLMSTTGTGSVTRTEPSGGVLVKQGSVITVHLQTH